MAPQDCLDLPEMNAVVDEFLAGKDLPREAGAEPEGPARVVNAMVHGEPRVEEILGSLLWRGD